MSTSTFTELAVDIVLACEQLWLARQSDGDPWQDEHRRRAYRAIDDLTDRDPNVLAHVLTVAIAELTCADPHKLYKLFDLDGESLVDGLDLDAQL